MIDPPVIRSSSAGPFRWMILLTMGLWFPAVLFADWPQFRGANCSGIYQGKPIPLEFESGKNERWSIKLTSGHSSPSLYGNDLFLTGFDQKTRQLEVICIDKNEGAIRWRRTVPARQIEKGHPSFNPASSTPACDGERVVAYFGSFGLICFDLKGQELWRRQLPLTRSYAGNATSPIIVGNQVILYRGNLVDHYLLSVDKKTGKTVWKKEQEEPFAMELACTACPVVWKDLLLVHSARSVQAVRIETGEPVWVHKCGTTATSTPVIAGNQLIVAAWNKMGEPALRPEFPSFEQLLKKHDRDGNHLIEKGEFPRIMIFHRPEGAEAPENGAAIGFRWTDTSRDGSIQPAEWKAQLEKLSRYRAGYKTHGLLSIRMDSSSSQQNVRTLETRQIPEVPSPVTWEGRVFTVKNGGVLSGVDLKSGKTVLRLRTRGRGTHYASPVIANHFLLSSAGDGTISIVDLKTQKLVSVNRMPDRVYATPAIDNGVLFVRTHSRLHAFGLIEPDN